IKNAAEFTIFTGRTVRIWDRGVTDWVTGMISAADTASVTLELDGGDVQMFPYEQIAKAQLL
ncbi:MAG: ribosome maturation factor, partial [Treponema sp.]|nr:ribosome maturation factor [Treponema sp.]